MDKPVPELAYRNAVRQSLQCWGECTVVFVLYNKLLIISATRRWHAVYRVSRLVDSLLGLRYQISELRFIMPFIIEFCAFAFQVSDLQDRVRSARDSYLGTQVLCVSVLQTFH